MPGNHGKIVGGTDASHGEFPYQVKWGGCGASILNENYVLTAAHCFNLLPSYFYPYTKLTIARLADLDISTTLDNANHVDFDIKEENIIVHES